MGGGDGGGRVEAGWTVGQCVEAGWGCWTRTGDLGVRLHIGVSRLPTKRQASPETSSLFRRFQSDSRRQTLMRFLSSPNAGEDCSHDALLARNLRRLVEMREIHSSSQKTAMFPQVPPAGFSKSLLPTQSRNSPARRHNSCSADKKYPLTHYFSSFTSGRCSFLHMS